MSLTLILGVSDRSALLLLASTLVLRDRAPRGPLPLGCSGRCPPDAGAAACRVQTQAVIGLLLYCIWQMMQYFSWLKTANVLTIAEKTFVCPELGGKRQPFPSVMDEPSVYLSLIVPSYKEEERLPRMLEETLVYLQRRQAREKEFTYEVLIVDDGSSDGTTTCALKFVHQYTSAVIRVLTLRQNRGKGFAVKTGMQHARGQLLLMVDADGATRIADLENLEARLRQVHQAWDAGKVRPPRQSAHPPCVLLLPFVCPCRVASFGCVPAHVSCFWLVGQSSGQECVLNGDCAIAIGSRAPPQALYAQDSVTVQRDASRSLVGNLFVVLRKILMPTEGCDVGTGGEKRALQDTQCGFKLFTRGAAQLIFNNQVRARATDRPLPICLSAALRASAGTERCGRLLTSCAAARVAASGPVGVRRGADVPGDTAAAAGGGSAGDLVGGRGVEARRGARRHQDGHRYGLGARVLRHRGASKLCLPRALLCLSTAASSTPS